MEINENQLEQEALTLKAEMAVEIVDQATYDAAVEIRIRAKERLREGEAFFAPMKQKAFDAHKEICAKEKLILDPLRNGITQIDRAIVGYASEQERIRREAQLRLQAEENARIEEERAKQAALLTAAGFDEETVEAAVEQAVPTAIVHAPQTYQKSAAISQRDNWSGEVEPGGLIKLIKFVAKNPAFAGLLQINQTALNQQARALKSQMNFPGVRAVNKPVIAGR